jgi:branched-chain amino acid transport system permease protein
LEPKCNVEESKHTMSLTFFYFTQNTIIFIILGWAIYLVYRNGKLYYMSVANMALCSYFVAYMMRDQHWSWYIAAIAAIIIGGFISFILSFGLARASAFTVVVVTIGMLVIFTTIIRNLGFLGGEMGFASIPKVKHISLITVILVILIGGLLYRLDNSRIGRAIGVTFVESDVAKTLGIDLFWLSVSLQVISGALGGLAGALYAVTMTNLQIYSFNFETLLLLICFVFVGGSTTMWGVVIATPILYGFPLVLPQIIADWRYIIYGLLLILILIFRPEGIIDKELIKKIKDKVFTKKITSIS